MTPTCRKVRRPQRLKAALPSYAAETSVAEREDIRSAPSSKLRRRLAWHLPDDFESRSPDQQKEILAWINDVIVVGVTDYRRHHTKVLQQRFSIQFSKGDSSLPFPAPLSLRARLASKGARTDALPPGNHRAPPRLDAEARDLILFKSCSLPRAGLLRNKVWNTVTARQCAKRLGALFGALAASPKGEIKGYGAPVAGLSFAMLTVPAVWDWFLDWRLQRRGFFTRTEVAMMDLATALTQAETGWMKQSGWLAHHLSPIEGLVTRNDVQRAHENWAEMCATMHRHAANRARDLERLARTHRDPFEPVMCVLDKISPLREYRKIVEEILRVRPDPQTDPLEAAEATRSLLMLRLALHLGVRSRNLRELLFRPRGGGASTLVQLDHLKRGELRWSIHREAWEVVIPASAFKNAGSTFFKGSELAIALPDIADLNAEIQVYIEEHRSVLLGRHKDLDSNTFFIRTVTSRSSSAAYSEGAFYEAWRTVIERYGIFNPYTGRGALSGLLPHGPHSVRHVLATHVLKETGSIEKASFAIQDTPESVAAAYARFSAARQGSARGRDPPPRLDELNSIRPEA